MAERGRSVIESTLAELALVLVFVFAMIAVGVAAVPDAPNTEAPPQTGIRDHHPTQHLVHVDPPPSPPPREQGPHDQRYLTFATQSVTNLERALIDLVGVGGKAAPCLLMHKTGPLNVATGLTVLDIAQDIDTQGVRAVGLTEDYLVERSLLALNIESDGDITVHYNLARHDNNVGGVPATRPRKHLYFLTSRVKDDIPRAEAIIESWFGSSHTGNFRGPSPSMVSRRFTLAEMQAALTGPLQRLEELGRGQGGNPSAQIPCIFNYDRFGMVNATDQHIRFFEQLDRRLNPNSIVRGQITRF